MNTDWSFVTLVITIFLYYCWKRWLEYKQGHSFDEKDDE